MTHMPVRTFDENYLDRSRSCNAILLSAVSALYYPITTIKVEWPVISQSRFFFQSAAEIVLLSPSAG